MHCCKSGEIIVMHDADIKRTANAKGMIANKTLYELKKIFLKNGERIPTLNEVLDELQGRIRVDIELKGSKTAKPVANMIKKYVSQKGWSYEDFLVSSFKSRELRTFKKELNKVKTMVLVQSHPLSPNLLARFAEADLVGFDIRGVRKSTVEKVQRKGRGVILYTVNKKREFEKIRDWGLRGIISDYPDKILSSRE